MLRQEQYPNEKDVPAEQVRVTPEELATAITRLEAHKDSTQRNLEATVAIGDVIQQLGLDASPEDILAEVERERARKLSSNKKPRTFRKRLRLSLITGVAIIGFTFGWRLIPNFSGNHSTNVATAPMVTLISLNPNLRVRDVSGKIEMLSEVGDNQPVLCIYDNLSSQFLNFVPNNGAAWTLIKHGNRIYVRGWLFPVSNKVMQTDGADVAANRDADYSLSVTLPVDSIKVLQPTGGINVFHAQDIHLDNHAYEKWQP